MTKEEYQAQIPHHCSLSTADEHMEVLLLCWGITHGTVAERFDHCRACELKVMAKRKGPFSIRQVSLMVNQKLPYHDAW